MATPTVDWAEEVKKAGGSIQSTPNPAGGTNWDEAVKAAGGTIQAAPSAVIPPTIARAPVDPLKRVITRPEDLPSQAEFDASHNAAVSETQDYFAGRYHGANPARNLRQHNLDRGLTPQQVQARGEAVAPLVSDSPLLPISKLAPEHPTTVLGGMAKGAAKLAEGLTTPTNIGLGVATGGLSKIPGVGPLLSKAASGIFGGQLLGGFIQDIPGGIDTLEKGTSAEKAEYLSKAVGSLAFGVMATKHALAQEAAPKVAPNARAILGDQTADTYFAGRQGPRTPPAEASASVFKDHGPTYIELFDEALRRQDEAAKKTADARPSPSTPRPSTAKEAAEVFKASPKNYTELFDDAEKAAADRAAASGIKGAKPVIPESGMPERVARVQDARERLATSLVGKSFGELANPDRLAIDDMVNEGYGFSDQAVKPDAPAPVAPVLSAPESKRPATASRDTAQTGKSGAQLPGNAGISRASGAPDSSIPAVDRGSDALPVSLPDGGKQPEASAVSSKESPSGASVPGEMTPPPDSIDWATAVEKAGGKLEVEKRSPTNFSTPREEIATESTPAQNQQVEGSKNAGPEAAAGAPKEPPPEEDAAPVQTVAKPKPRTPAGALAGRETNVAIPGEPSNNYPARYVVREMGDVHASHSGINFEPNADYEHVNDRDYKSNSHLQASIVEKAGIGFNPDFLTTDSPTAEHGPSIIDQRGNVLGGNSRVQTIQRVNEMNPAGRDRYISELKMKAQAYGIDPAAIDKMKNPVLLRELTGEHEPQKAITDFNKGAPAKLSPEEQAVTDGRRFSAKTVEDLASRLGDLGESGSLADALRGDKGAEVLNHLERDGVITPQEKGGMVDERDQLTPEIKARISKALVGRLFEKPAEFRNTQPAMRNKLERIAPQVLRVESNPEWALTDRVREALALNEEARAHKMTPEEVAAQRVIGKESRRWHPEAVQIAETLNEGPINATYAFRRYANAEQANRPTAQMEFIDPPTRAEAFLDSFGSTPVESMPKEEQPMGQLEALLRDQRGSVRMLTREDIDKLKLKYMESPIKAAVDVVRPLGSRIAAEGGGAGRVLMSLIARAGDKGEVHAGQLLARIAETRPSRLTKKERFQVLDAMEGRAKAPTDKKVKAVYEAYKSADDEIGANATAMGVEIQTKNGKRPFAAMENHFPHILRSAKALKSGAVRADVIENIQRLGIADSKKAATALLDDWTEFLESGKRRDNLIKSIAKLNGITEDAAFAKMQKNRTNIAKHGSLEYSRELNLPFYDPDPVRVMPFVLATGAKRLAQIATFGQDHRVINQEILRIARSNGNPEFVRKSVDKMIGQNMEGDTAEVRLSRALRTLSSLKLAMSAIPNATQGLNALVAADLPSFAAGVRGAFTEKGRRFAIESGASIEPVLAEAHKELGGGRLVEGYLSLSQFTRTERFNRALSAITGAKYADRLFKAATGKGAGAETARGRLRDLGVDVTAAIKDGKLSEQDKLMAAKKFSDATQFRTRPEDMPDIMSSGPMAKALFQFKSFAYQQARFMAKQTIGEVKSGNYGKGIRNLVILGALYPAAGELVRTLKNGISGREQEFDDGITQYFEDLAQSGTAGLFADVIQAGGRGKIPELVGGPAVGQAVDMWKMLDVLADGDKDGDEKTQAIKKYALTRLGSVGNRLLDQE